MPHEFKIGDRVVKNEQTWVLNDFDGGGRRISVGMVVEPSFRIDDLGAVDVRWPLGRCFEKIEGLFLAPEFDESASQ